MKDGFIIRMKEAVVSMTVVILHVTVTWMMNFAAFTFATVTDSPRLSLSPSFQALVALPLASFSMLPEKADL